MSLYYADKETGNFYAQRRDAYNQAIGAFPQSDPIGLKGGLNTYSYVKGNPIAYTDPLGTDVLSDNAMRAAGLPPPGPLSDEEKCVAKCDLILGNACKPAAARAPGGAWGKIGTYAGCNLVVYGICKAQCNKKDQGSVCEKPPAYNEPPPLF